MTSEIWYINIRGILSNLSELSICIQNEKPLVIFISETFLSSIVPDRVVNIPGYQLIRMDRDTFGGGLIIYVSCATKYKINNCTLNTNFECIDLTLKLKIADLHTLLIYRPPGADLSVLNFIEQRLDDSTPSFNTVSLIIGDFNVHNSKWWPHNTTDNYGIETDLFCTRQGLAQLVNSPTRFPDSLPGSPSLIDLALTNTSELFTRTYVSAPIGSTDHGLVHLVIPTNESTCDNASVNNELIPDFNNLANWDTIHNAITTSDWSQLLQSNNINQAVDIFNSIVTEIIDTHVPKRRVGKPGKHTLPFITPEFLRLSEMKAHSWSEFLTSNSQEHLNTFRHARDNLKRESRQIRRSYYLSTAQKLSVTYSPRLYWRMARDIYKFSDTTDVIPDLEHNGLPYTTDFGKANLLNQFYSNPDQFQTDCKYPNPNASTSAILDDLNITQPMILNKLKSLDCQKSTGPDNIPNIFLFNCAELLCTHLAFLFSLSLESGIVPIAWKTAYVTPIYKRKGDRSQVRNYRPISITSCVGKILESLLNDALTNHLLSNSLISASQFGFLPKHSAVDQLAIVYHKWISAAASNQESVAAFLDLANAFTTVPHQALRHKLPSFGVRGKFFSWISDYLRERVQFTRVNQTLSDMCTVQAGVPQGSVLAPTLFIIFINDLLTNIEDLRHTCPDSVNLFPAAYADDTLISISSSYFPLALAFMRQAFKVASAWSRSWGMKFNATKTMIMRLSNRNTQVTSSELTFEGCRIPFSTEHKHLGVIISSDLKLNRQVEEVCKKARKEIFVLRILRLRMPPNSNTLLLKLYKAYIRCHLEYASVLLCGAGKMLANCLEGVQRAAIRVILGLPYRQPLNNDHYEELSLDYLQFRRNSALACLTHKMFYQNCSMALQHFAPTQRTLPYDVRRRAYTHFDGSMPILSRLCKRSCINLLPGVLNLLERNCLQRYSTLPDFKIYVASQRTNNSLLSFPYC